MFGGICGETNIYYRIEKLHYNIKYGEKQHHNTRVSQLKVNHIYKFVQNFNGSEVPHVKWII